MILNTHATLQETTHDAYLYFSSEFISLRICSSDYTQSVYIISSRLILYRTVKRITAYTTSSTITIILYLQASVYIIYKVPVRKQQIKWMSLKYMYYYKL